MLHLLARFTAIIVAFAPLFRCRTCRHAEILRLSDLSRERHFVSYHRVLSRAR
jgi:hypothetical protein